MNYVSSHRYIYSSSVGATARLAASMLSNQGNAAGNLAFMLAVNLL